MDLVWYARYKRGGGGSGPLDWEFAAGLNDWASAPAPAQVGKRLAEAFLQRELSPDLAAFTTNVVHWAYGLFWGSVYGILAGSSRFPHITYGLPFGAAVWTASYVALPLAKVYKPMWEYDAATLGKDLSAHLAYGLGTAAAFRFLSRK